MDFIPLLAHVSHWWMWILYLVPVLVVLTASIRALVEQRREDRGRGAVGKG
jgi:hypothetical protein